MKFGPAAAVGIMSVLVALAACTPGESEEDRAVDAVANGLVTDASLAAYDISVAEGECLGRHLVDELGADVVLELEGDDGALWENVQPEQIAALGDGLDTCLANIDSITRDLLTENLPAASEVPEETGRITADQAACIADAVVGDVSLARLITIGAGNEEGAVTPLTVAEATTFAVAYVNCTNARADVLAEVAAQGATPDEVACFDQLITDADLVDRFTAGLLGEPEPDVFAAAAADCF